MENKEKDLELQTKEAVTEEQKEVKHHFDYLRNLLGYYANYFATLDKEKIDVAAFLINYNLSLADFVKDVTINKNADEVDALSAFVKVTISFLSVLCTQGVQFYEQGEQGMNIAVENLSSTEEIGMNDLIFNMLKIETTERINIFAQYAICFTILNRLYPSINKKDIELVFKLKLKDLK